LLLAMGLENVFFRTRPIVLSLARSTISSSTTFFSNIRKVQRARPLGGLEHANAINLASFSPSKIRATGGVARCLRLKTASRSYGAGGEGVASSSPSKLMEMPHDNSCKRYESIPRRL
jgi:hypothetical protein